MTAAAGHRRLRVSLTGAVQGVGFRPFLHRLASGLELAGTVRNSASGLWVEVEGTPERLREFLDRLDRDRPAAARIAARETVWLEPAGYNGFQIQSSDSGDRKTAAVLPDLATCADCLDEIHDRAARRSGYAFTNCTACGPRYSILNGIPYDRSNTTMAGFRMCSSCEAEYRDVQDRRFHAQPIACPHCGPRLRLLDEAAQQIQGDPVAGAASALRDGRIVALKGIGGFQLLVDALNDAAVRRLRERKHREEKPFAVMFPDARSAALYCEDCEDAELASAAAPIVLLRPRAGNSLPAAVCGGSPFVGAFLPYSPLHHLLLDDFRGPVVATSGNLSEEPIVTEEADALARLGGIADVFLTHDRPIARACDDSVVRGRMVMRRARGYAPLPVHTPFPLRRVLAVGGHLKNAVAIGWERQVVLSQHIGDLETESAFDAFLRAIDDLSRLYDFRPEAVACDLHPEYISTKHALGLGLPVIRVQHHQAHAAACASENDVAEPYLGVAWDGAGYGVDGTIWGGEFFLAERGAFTRVAHPLPFGLPGGDAAMRDCRRSAFSVMRQAGLECPLVDQTTARVFERLLASGVQAPQTTSVGRLFDAVAAMSGVRARSAYEGQAAMLLEASARDVDGMFAYEIRDGVIDWRPMIRQIASGRMDADEIAGRFHNTLAGWIVDVASATGCDRVVMGGGCFQNARLSALARERLEHAGFRAYLPQRVPPNDGGLALGQAIIAGR